MDFRIDAEVSGLVARIRAFVDDRLIPLEPRLLQQGLGPLLPEVRALRAEVRTLGLWGPNYPREYGGLGLDLVAHGLVSNGETTGGRMTVGN